LFFHFVPVFYVLFVVLIFVSSVLSQENA